MDAFPVVTSDQLAGLPHWAHPAMVPTVGSGDFFDVQVSMDLETAAEFKRLSPDRQREVRRSMMLQVLTNHCKLKYHKETRELPIYNLVVTKNGPKFQETPAGKEANWHELPGEISGDAIGTSEVAYQIRGSADRPIVDKTGLTGKYSLSLKWNPLDWPRGVVLPQAYWGRPDLVKALQDQLGLKLESSKGPVDVYVIDHIEKPSEN